MQALEHLLLALGQVGHQPVQKQRGLIEQTLRGLNVLQHDAFGDGLEPFFLDAQFLAGKDDDRHLRERWSVWI